MKLGREIAGLARSIKYDLRHSRRARMYVIVAGFSFAAVSAAAVAAGQMPGLAESTSHHTTGQADEEIGPAGITEQQEPPPVGQGGAFTQGAKPPHEPDELDLEEEPTTESGEWEQPSQSPSSSPEPEPSPTTPSPDPSDSESPSETPSDSDSPSETPSETPSGKE